MICFRDLVRLFRCIVVTEGVHNEKTRKKGEGEVQAVELLIDVELQGHEGGSVQCPKCRIKTNQMDGGKTGKGAS